MLGSDKYRFDKLLVCFDWEPTSRSPAREARALRIRQLRPVDMCGVATLLSAWCGRDVAQVVEHLPVRVGIIRSSLHGRGHLQFGLFSLPTSGPQQGCGMF